MTTIFTLNKLSLTEQNISQAQYVRHAIPNAMANDRILDEIYGISYDVQAPYFKATNTKSGETTTMNTVELAEYYENYDFIDQLADMGFIRNETHQSAPTFKPAVS